MGSRERRVDTYQLYGINDIGVKRRNRRTLEVKVRRTLGAHLNLGYGLEGRIEEWTRWTPDEDEGTWQSADKGWVGVHKVVHTRTFAPTGKQLALPTREPARSDIGCDIEVVAINALKSDTWSLSLEAYGPTVERRAALETSWSALQMHSPLPEAFAFMFDRACGYPEWLRLVT